MNHMDVDKRLANEPHGRESSLISMYGRKNFPPILAIGDVLISSDLLTEPFCCDLDACHGACCVEGDAGAPVTMDEVMQIEDSLDDVWEDLSASAQAVIDRQGVAYTDQEGDLVTSIVNGKDCVFTCHEDLTLDNGHTIHDCCLCTFEKAVRKKMARNGGSPSLLEVDSVGLFIKPISCALYPIREKTFSDGTVGLNYHRWEVCRPAVLRGRQLGLKVYQALRVPLIRRFGQEWYDELCDVAKCLSDESRNFSS